MTKLEDLTKAVEQLAPKEFAEFRDWFEQLQARLWDEQIERGMKARDWISLPRTGAQTARKGRSRIWDCQTAGRLGNGGILERLGYRL